MYRVKYHRRRIWWRRRYTIAVAVNKLIASTFVHVISGTITGVVRCPILSRSFSFRVGLIMAGEGEWHPWEWRLHGWWGNGGWPALNFSYHVYYYFFDAYLSMVKCIEFFVFIWQGMLEVHLKKVLGASYNTHLFVMLRIATVVCIALVVLFELWIASDLHSFSATILSTTNRTQTFLPLDLQRERESMCDVRWVLVGRHCGIDQEVSEYPTSLLFLSLVCYWTEGNKTWRRNKHELSSSAICPPKKGSGPKNGHW